MSKQRMWISPDYTNQQRQVLEALRMAGYCGLTIHQLGELVPNANDGGPMGRNNLYVHIHRLRRGIHGPAVGISVQPRIWLDRFRPPVEIVTALEAARIGGDVDAA
jgi:hypothetical protein